jgi:Zn-dependent protease
MKLQPIKLGKLAGIPICLDYSWFLIFALFTWTLATGYFPKEFSGWPTSEYWVVSAITAIFLFVSVLLHEIGHSVVALRYKVPVKKITLFIFGGVAQIATDPPHAMSEFLIAIAGPLVSFALAGLFGLFQQAFTGSSPFFALAKYLAYINGTLGLFNLIPGFPLDGGRVFRAIVWGVTHNFRRATLIAANTGRVIAFLFIMVGLWQMFSGNFAGGLWIAFIGWFLENAAHAQVKQQKINDLLEGHPVSQAMTRMFTTVALDATLDQIAGIQAFGDRNSFFVVMDGEEIKGLLSLKKIMQVPQAGWGSNTAQDLMIPGKNLQSTNPDTELVEDVSRMEREGINQLLVIKEGRVVGILNMESLINFLRTLQQLKHNPPTPHHLSSNS